MADTAPTPDADFNTACRRAIDSVVRPVFQRCCTTDTGFFDDFYYRLGERLPEVGAMFARVDMEKQNELVRDGIATLIDFADRKPGAERELVRLGELHSRSRLDIPPEFYPEWVNALMETVRDHDASVDDEMEAVWRDVLSGGITLLTSSY